MSFSLVTVTYNSAQTLRDTITSVLSQTHQAIEYIIIDGFSKDNTVAIIKEYEPLFNGRLKWISEKDNGLYDAMNKGFQMATGDVIGIINSDDLISDPNAIEKVIKCFEADNSIDAVYADLYYVAQNDISKIVRYWKSGSQRPFSKGWHPAHPWLSAGLPFPVPALPGPLPHFLRLHPAPSAGDGQRLQSPPPYSSGPEDLKSCLL